MRVPVPSLIILAVLMTAPVWGQTRGLDLGVRLPTAVRTGPSRAAGGPSDASGGTVVVAPGYNPATVAELVLKADTLALTSGASVTTWPNTGSGGASLNATGATVPTYVTNVVNGKPVVRFAGSGQKLTVANFPFTGPLSILAVVRFTAADLYAAIAMMGPADIVELRGSAANYTPELIVNATQVGAGPPGIMTAWHLVEGVYSGGTATGYLDGTLQASLAIAAPSTADKTVTIGNSPAPQGQDLIGDIAEVVVVGTNLAVADRQKLEGYLAWKYGLQGNLPAGHPYKSAAP